MYCFIIPNKRKEVKQKMVDYPVIDLRSTGARINELRRERGITVDDLRVYLGMNNPNSIYKWFRGEVLPTLENMYALSVILEVPIDDIIGRTA